MSEEEEEEKKMAERRRIKHIKNRAMAMRRRDRIMIGLWRISNFKLMIICNLGFLIKSNTILVRSYTKADKKLEIGGKL